MPGSDSTSPAQAAPNGHAASRGSSNGHRVRQIRPQDPSPPPIVAGQWGTDGRAIFQRIQIKDEDGQPEQGKTGPVIEWRKRLRCDVRFAVDRRPAPDPDFGEHADADDLPEATSDVEVLLEGQDAPLVFRNMITSDLTKAKFLDMAGRRAFLGMSRAPTSTIRGEIFNAVNELSEVRQPREDVFYAVTGWHTDPARNDGRPFFVTGNGAIGPDGYLPGVVSRLCAPLAVYAPQDAPTGSRLIDAFESVIDLYGAMPGRVLVPLIGARLRALFGVYRDPSDLAAGHETVPVANMTGNTGNGKSGAQAATANVIAPGMRHNGIPFKCGDSGKMAGASGPGMESLLFMARDLPTDWDDLDPNDTEEHRAAWQSQLIRRAAGQQARTLSRREGGLRAFKPCRAGVILNGEPLSAQESAENRAFNIELQAGDIKLSALRDLTGAADRGLRSELGGGVIRAIAADRAGWLAILAEARSALRPLFADGEVPGPVSRGADCFAELAAAWFAVLLMLRQNGMSAMDARCYWILISGDLQDAWKAHLGIIGRGTRSSKALAIIEQGISSGVITLASARNPKCPPIEARFQHGWTMTQDGEWREPKPVHGYIDDRPDKGNGDLLLKPIPTAGAVRSMGAAAGEPMTGGVKTLATSLKTEGVLTGVAASDLVDGELTDRPTLGDGSRTSVWRIPVAHLDGGGQPPEITSYAGSVDYGKISGGAELDPACLESPAADTVAATATAPEPVPDDDPSSVPEPVQARSEPPVPASSGPAEPPRRAVSQITPTEELATFARVIRDEENGWPEATDQDIAQALDNFHEVTDGGRYVSWAGQTGQALFARLLARFPSMVPPAPVTSPAIHEVWKSRVNTHLNYVTKGHRFRAGQRFTGYDINGQFPAAAGSTELGDGEPTSVSNPRSIGALIGLPGYLQLAEPLRTGHPAFGTVAAGIWLPMPFVKFLAADLGLPVNAAEVLYWPRHGKRLGAYVKHAYREPRKQLAEMPPGLPVAYAMGALKQQANAFIGMWRSEVWSGKGIYYRPDWNDMIVATAEVNALRAFRKCSVQPVAKAADCAYWVAGHESYVPAGLEITSQLGKWKPERTGPVTERFIAAYRAGQPRNVHQAAKAVGTERRAA